MKRGLGGTLGTVALWGSGATAYDGEVPRLNPTEMTEMIVDMIAGRLGQSLPAGVIRNHFYHNYDFTTTEMYLKKQ